MSKKNILLLSFIMILFVSCEKKTEKAVKTVNVLPARKYQIRVGYMPDFSGTSAVAIAKEKGFFDEEHLDVTLIKFLDGPSEVEEMLLKNLEFAYIGHGAHSLAIEGKVNVLFPNALSRAEQIIVRNAANIESVKDLRGKKVGTQIGTSSEILLYLALQSLGIKTNELDIINMNGNTIVSSMISNTIDAASVQAPYSFEILNSLGDKVKSIATTVDYSDVGSFPSSWIVTPSFQKNNADIVNGNTYTWTINENNYQNKPIEMLLEKSLEIEDIIPRSEASNLSFIVVAVIIFVALIVIVFVRHKAKKNNNI